MIGEGDSPQGSGSAAPPHRVLIPSPLHSYTGGRAEVEARGASVGAVLADLERLFGGFRFRIIDEHDRIRTHILIFVAGRPARGLDVAVGPGEDVQIVAALSGG